MKPVFANPEIFFYLLPLIISCLKSQLDMVIFEITYPNPKEQG